MGRIRLALIAIALLTVPAAAQEAPPEGGTLPPGSIYLTEALDVKVGETLRIGPGTSITGPGNISVWGLLIVNGTEASPASLSVQVRVLDGGEVRLHQARLWGVNDTALEVFGGMVSLAEVLVEGNTRAALVKGDGIFEAEDVIFRDHAGEALYIEGAAQVRLERTTFSSNGRGATLYSASAFVANDSIFSANGQHLVIDLGPWTSADPQIALARNAFRAPATTPAALPGILLRQEGELSSGAPRLVTMQDNRIEGAPVGLRAEGRGLSLESTNDTFVDNAIGVSVQLATVHLTRATLGNARNLDGSGHITLDEPLYVNAPPLVPATTSEGRPWIPYAIGGGIVLALGGALFARRFLPATRSTPPPPPPPEPAAVVPVQAPMPDLTAPLTAVERRILDDMIANPGTAQRAVADRLGYTRQALHYHVKKLEARGLVRKTVEGRETRCFVPPSVAAALRRGLSSGALPPDGGPFP